MITFVLLLALAWQFYLGYNRGLVKQIYLCLSLVVALLIAQSNYRPLADKLAFWVPYIQAVEEKTLTYFPQVSIFEMDHVFYTGLAYFGLVLISYLCLRLLAIFLHFLPLERWDKRRYNLISGALSLLLTVVCWNMFFTLVATVPFSQVQQLVENHVLIKFFIQFPILANVIRRLWIG